MIKKSRNRITTVYQWLHFLKSGIISGASFICAALSDTGRQWFNICCYKSRLSLLPEEIIPLANRPSTIPIISPSATLLIKNPIISPMIMSTVKLIFLLDCICCCLSPVQKFYLPAGILFFGSAIKLASIL